jgi:hypothetical protein
MGAWLGSTLVSSKSRLQVFEPIIEFELRLEDAETGYFDFVDIKPLPAELAELEAASDELLLAIFVVFGTPRAHTCVGVCVCM